MRNCDLQRRLLWQTRIPVDALIQAIIAKNYNNLKLTNKTRANNNNRGRVYKNLKTVKTESNLNIENSNTCMKCGKVLSKRHLNFFPAKEINCNSCKYKGHFGRFCKSKGRRIFVNNVEENENNQNCPYSPGHPQLNAEEKFVE